MASRANFTSRIKSLSVKTVRQVKDTPSLQVNPPEIVFKDIELNQIYQITVEIRNLSKKAVRIRLEKPTNPCFKIEYHLKEKIAPELTMLAKIKYESVVLKNENEKIIIATDDGCRLELPIRVYTMQSHLLFEPFINMGFIKVGKVKEERIAFKNEGKTKGEVTFTHNHNPYLTIKPTSLTIEPGHVQYLNVKFKSDEPGLFKGEILLKSQSVLLKNTIEIHATTVQFSRFFIDSHGQQQTMFDFGDMYVGQFSQITTYLINNSPKAVSFRTVIRNGLKISPEEFNLVQSPAQLGHEQNQKILFCEPDHGEIKSFSQIKIRLICKSRISYKDQIYTKNYALTPLGEEINYAQSNIETSFKPSTSHEYSIMFEFDDNDPLIVQTKGNTHCPLVKVERNLFKFGDCPSHQEREIKFTVKNVIPSRKVILFFPKIPNFSIEPNKVSLEYKKQVELKAIFEPKNIGKFDTTQALIVNQFYQIPLRFFGISSTAGKKEVNKDSLTNRSQLNPLETETRKKAFSLTAQRSFVNKIKSLDVPNDKMIELSGHFANKLKFDMVLKEGRETRIEAQKQKQVKHKWQLYTNKLKQLGVDKKYNEQFDEEGVPNAPPIDYEFQSGMIDGKISQQRIELPKNNEELYVNKHIGSYNPPDKKKSKNKYEPDEDVAPKKYRTSKPENHKQQRQICSELTSNELEQINVGPMSLHFGELYVKCPTSKHFWVKNSTMKSIIVRLQSNKPELSKSNFAPQIIPSFCETGFEIVLCKDLIGDVNTTMKYIINEKYTFEISIVGKITPVSLDLSESQVKFNFDETNLEMFMSKRVILTNNGNGKAFFKFVLGKERLFIPNVLEGVLQPKTVVGVWIKFTAPVITVPKNQYVYTQKLSIKVLDGVESSLTCTAFIPECRVNVTPQSFDFGNVCIGKQIIKTLTFNNNISKYSTVAHVDTQGYAGLHCSGKLLIPAESTQQMEVKFKADIEGEMLAKINIRIRGSKPRVVECRARVIKPNLTFDKVIDFDNMVVMGQAGVKKLTVVNPSEVEVPLIIDLREHQLEQVAGIECIELKVLNKDAKLQLYKDKPIEPSYETSNMLDELELDDEQESDPEDSSSEALSKHQQEEEAKRFLITLRPKVNYEFQIKFKAKKAIDYEFRLPWSIKNHGQISCPIIKATGIEPKFIFDPQLIDFKKKIITTPDKCYPKYIEISISNPDTQPVSWELDTSTGEFTKQQVFSISQKSGKLEAGEVTKIKVSFNPFEVGEFKYVLPLYLQSPTMKRSKYLDVEIRGVSSFPRLLFSKREVILPVVPLNTLAEASFNVLNDGYQNALMKYQFVDDVANLNLKLNFPDGNTLGLTRHKFRCEVGFIYPKPISFSIKLEFVDEFNRSYFITVSGSTDNCLFTNYGFFLRNEGRFKIIVGDSLNVMEIEEQTRVRKTSAASMKSGTTNKSLRSLISYLGPNMIKPGLLEETISYLTRFLNSNVLTMKIQEFPRSLIESDGVQLFEIINFFTTKGTNFPWKCTVKDKGAAKVKALYTQYSEFIKMLKIEGAQLNHIRPEYLLSFSDLNIYLQDVLTADQKKCLSVNLTRVNPTLFNYLSMDSWISLLYQIFRIYFLFRLTPKSYKSHLSSSQEGKQLSEIPKGYLEGSNFLSTSEGIILHWVESSVSEILLEERRVTNFEKDFKDGVIIAVLLQKYTGSTVLKQLKNPCVFDEDYKYNAEQTCKALEEVGLGSHLIPKDIYHPLQRQMLLFLVHLYHYLPYYAPQGPPIEFSCVLGQEVVRTIELTNPSSKPVNYVTKYEGSDDFVLLGEKQFRIEPKKTYRFEVKFVSRVSVPVTGKVSFINKKQNSIVAAAVVFNLQSAITGKISDKIWNISGLLYDQVDFPIDIVNKFTGAEVAEFNVSIVTEYIYQNNKKTKHSIYKPLSKQNELPTIFSKFDVVRLRKNVPTQFHLSFIPTSMYTTKSTIIFSNFQVGEFQHEIVATVEAPPIIADIRPPITLSVDQTAHYEYSLVFRNQAYMKARKSVEMLKKLSITKKSTIKDTLVKKNTIDEPSSVILYVDIPPNPYISSKNHIILNDRKQTSKRREDQKQVIQLQNKLPLSYNCKNPVLDYSVIVTLMNAEKTDVRRYRLLMTVQPKPLKAILEMTTPARNEITQSLPIVNNTERDWVIKVIWEPNMMKNGHYFSVPEQYRKQFTVKKQSVGNFPLTFKPKWIQKAQARLVLSNAITMDQFEYEVRGIGEEPLQQQHFDIQCKTKETVYREIIVRNPYFERAVTFRVQTDLMNCTVPTTVTIQPNSKQKVLFSVKPILSGEYTGSIIFSEENGEQYMWYTVTVVTNQPNSSGTIRLEGKIRELVTRTIEIENKSGSDCVYEVAIMGESLYGESTFVSKANSVSKYQLAYLPLAEGQLEGTICFVNETEGEILYNLITKGEQNSVEYIKCSCSLGTSFQQLLQLHNPSNIEASIEATNSNLNSFDIEPKHLKLGPGQTKQVKVYYTPSSMDSVERAQIQFVSKEIGKWRFSLEGSGTPPVATEPETIYTTLYNEKTNIILFKNPFNYAISMGISMEFTGDSAEVFKLLIKNKVQHIEPREYLEIPYSFIPTSCRRYSCKIVATINSELKWSFPIIGISEVMGGKMVSFKTKCREKEHQSVQVSLKEAVNFGSGYQYNYKLENIPKYAEILVNKFLTINQNKSALGSVEEQLDFDFYFKPLKPCMFGFDLVIEEKTGPRWRYKVSLEATEPDVDDTIEIESPLLVTTSVAFKLTNRVKAEAQFTAKFTSDSANEFSVEPKQGILPSYNQQGKKFIVSFTPIEYGKQKRGKLKIETDSMYWSYLLKGNLPKYNPPKGESDITARGDGRVKSISLNNRSISKS